MASAPPYVTHRVEDYPALDAASKQELERLFRALNSNSAGSQQVLANILSIFDASGKTLAKPTWLTPTLINGWVNYGDEWAPAGYSKDSSGIVRLRGLVRNGTNPGRIATLPLGYRPAYRAIFNQQTYPGAVAARVDVTREGFIQALSGVSNNWLSLEGISFLAEK